MEFDRDQLNRAFEMLGRLLDEEGAAPVHLVVSGGAAILLQHIAERTTHDVDIIAQRNVIDGDLMPSWPLPESLKEATREVAMEVGFSPSWVNATTSLMMIQLEDLPQALWSDLETRNYGPCLQVSLVGREGLIYLKLWAASNRNEERDLVDLVALAPTADEVQRAAGWMKAQELLNHSQWEQFQRVKTSIGHE